MVGWSRSRVIEPKSGATPLCYLIRKDESSWGTTNLYEQELGQTWGADYSAMRSTEFLC